MSNRASYIFASVVAYVIAGVVVAIVTLPMFAYAWLSGDLRKGRGKP